jgi:NADPH:quinone reductase
VLQSRGLYQVKPELPYVPGQVVAGIVRQAPAGAATRAGDRVAAMPGGGGFAELAIADPGRVFPLPANVSFASAAAGPLNYVTAHFAYTMRGRRCWCTAQLAASVRPRSNSRGPWVRG